MPQTPESGLEPPTWKRLTLSAAIAAAAATVALVAFVLPAEYGIDPLGIGRALGLTALSEGAEARTIEIVDVVGGNETVIVAEIPAAGEPVPLPNPAVHQDEAGPPRTEMLAIALPPEAPPEAKLPLGTATAPRHAGH